MQGSGYLHKLGDKSAIIPCEPKKTPDLSDNGGGGPFSDSIYFPLISCYSLGRDYMSEICNLPAE